MEDIDSNHSDEPEEPGRIPGAKQPRTRPPSGLRDKLGFLHKSMPKFSGPYSVGTMEIEVPVENPRHISNIKRNHVHLLSLETVLFTLYYPCAHGSGNGKDPSGSRTWSRSTWLPRPRLGTAHGFGKFAGVGAAPVPFFAATCLFTKLPAYRNAALADHWPPHHNMHDDGARVKNMSGVPPPGESEEPTFPLLIFSHGLGGTRTMYSSLCGEFASYGFVVAAVEHRDGSGPRSYINYAKQGLGSMDEREKAAGVEHTPQARKKHYDKVDYVFPKDNPMDTAPNNDKGVDAELRDAQIEFRICEIEEMYRVIAQIANGHGKTVEQHNLRQKGFKGSSSRGLKGVDWDRWTNRVYLDDVTMAGHSFGAATTVELLRKYPDRFPQLKQGIIYDIWGAPIRAEDEERERSPHPKTNDYKINRPLLAINSEAFTYWRSNFELVTKLVQEAREQGVLSWLMTIRGTVHVNQSDFPLLYPHLCSWFLKMTANPRRAIDLNIDASLEFLKIVMPARIAQLNRSLQSENLLAVSPLAPHRLPTDQIRKPQQKWIAARIKIPNEMRWRLSPQIVVKQKHAAHHRQGTPQKTSEIWMHVAPDADELRAKARRESIRMGIVPPDPDEARAVQGDRLAQQDSAAENMAGDDGTASVAGDRQGDRKALKDDAEVQGHGGKKSLLGKIEQKVHVGDGFD